MMITITNSKLDSFKPKWAHYPGFSLLFNNPGNSLEVKGNYSRLKTDSNIDFYRTIHDALDTIGGQQLTTTYLLALLPYESWHVTVFDGINAFKLSQVHEEIRPVAEEFINELPGSLTTPPKLIRDILGSDLLQHSGLSFSFDSLRVLNNKSLTLMLSLTEHSMSALKDLERMRQELHGTLFSAERQNGEYHPHVTLGYFANKEPAQLASAHRMEWENVFKEMLTGKTISFPSIGFYGYKDMATFITFPR